MRRSSHAPSVVVGALALVLGLGPMGAHARALAPARAGVRAQPPPVEVEDLAEDLEAPAEELEEIEGTVDETIQDADPIADPEALDELEPEPELEEPATVDVPARVPTPTVPPATHDVPADDYESERGLAPGGYYGHGVILERPPPTGRNQIVLGSILVPLGTIATVSSAVGTWLTVPQYCGERLAGVGIEADEARCQGLFTFNVIRTTYGALMLVSGGTILVLGLLQRERYRKWRREHGMRARLEPGPAGLRLRF